MSREILLWHLQIKTERRGGVYGENDFDDGGERFVKS